MGENLLFFQMIFFHPLTDVKRLQTLHNIFAKGKTSVCFDVRFSLKMQLTHTSLSPSSKSIQAFRFSSRSPNLIVHLMSPLEKFCMLRTLPVYQWWADYLFSLILFRKSGTSLSPESPFSPLIHIFMSTFSF